MKKNKRQEGRKSGAYSLTAIITKGGKSLFTAIVDALERVSEGFWALFEAEKPKKNEKVVKYIITCAIGLIIPVFTIIISLCKFGNEVYPMGIALLCAVGELSTELRRKRLTPFIMNLFITLIFSGVMLSSFFVGRSGIIYFCIYVIVFVSRLFMTRYKLNEPITGRITVSAASAICAGLIVFIIYGDFTVSDIITLSVATPVLCFLLCGMTRVDEDEELTEHLVFDKSIHTVSAVGAILYAFIGSMRDVNVYLFSLGVIISTIITMTVAKNRGALFGALCGFLCGMALKDSVLNDYGVIYSSVFAVSGLFAGLLFEYSGIIAMMSAFCIACAYSLYASGLSGFGAVAADYLLGLIIFFFISRFIPTAGETKKVRLKPQADTTETYTAESAELMANKRLKYNYRIKKLSEAFESLSNEFFALSDKLKKPQITQASHIVSTTASELCSECGLSNVCWGKEYSATQDVTMKLSLKLQNNGKIEREDIGEHFRTKCIRLDRLINGVNTRYAELCTEYFKNNRTQLLAGEYSTVSRLLKGAMDEIETDSLRNEVAERKSRGALEELEIKYDSVFSYGVRGIIVDVSGVYPAALPISQREITECFSRHLGGSFEEPEFLRFGEAGVMRLKRKRLITLECAKASCAKSGETVNGDSTGFFENDNDYFYTLICDGMGSGRDAALTSRLATLFIERLLTCSGEKNITLEMLNGFLLTKSEESFTTVDLLELDLINSQACFIKAGASASYVVREGRLYKISSRTPPAGIIKCMTAEQTRLQLEGNDIIVMLSDGIIDAGDTGMWLLELLTSVKREAPAELSKRIIDEAKVRRGRCDDMTVAVVKVLRAA